MDKFLEYNLLSLKQEEIEYLKRPITRNEIKAAIKKLSTSKRIRRLYRWILPNIPRTNSYPYMVPKNWRGRNASKLILQSTEKQVNDDGCQRGGGGEWNKNDKITIL